jgi:hypothetical protein
MPLQPIHPAIATPALAKTSADSIRISRMEQTQEASARDTFCSGSEAEHSISLLALRMPSPPAPAPTKEPLRGTNSITGPKPDERWLQCCDALQKRLHDIEKNEILRVELQNRFVAEIAAAEASNQVDLDRCFEQAFAKFSVSRPQRHWQFLADVFKPDYISEAFKIINEAGLAK